MKFFDALLGRTPEVKANLDALFALPSAAITLEAAAGLTLSGEAAVCYKPGSGSSFADTQRELEDTLAVDSADTGVREETDTFGYHWVVVESPTPEDLVNRAHMVNATLEGRGFGPQLLCSVFGLRPDGGDRTGSLHPAHAGPASVYLVYLYKRGTFYPFAPLPGERRDNECELRLRGVLEGELPVEADLTRWFPLWGLPLR